VSEFVNEEPLPRQETRKKGGSRRGGTIRELEQGPSKNEGVGKNPVQPKENGSKKTQELLHESHAFSPPNGRKNQ